MLLLANSSICGELGNWRLVQVLLPENLFLNVPIDAAALLGVLDDSLCEYVLVLDIVEVVLVREKHLDATAYARSPLLDDAAPVPQHGGDGE